MEYEFRYDGHTHRVTLEKRGGAWRSSVDGRALEFHAVALEPHVYSLLIGGESVTAVVVNSGAARHVAIGGRVIVLEEPLAEGFGAKEEAVAAGVQTLRAPMPGKVVKILVPEGAPVAKGQTVLVVEAMKMEHGLTAAGAGVVQKLLCAEGQGVAAHQALAEIAIE